jgi:hypothetical protein
VAINPATTKAPTPLFVSLAPSELYSRHNLADGDDGSSMDAIFFSFNLPHLMLFVDVEDGFKMLKSVHSAHGHRLAWRWQSAWAIVS